jgi:mRNA interferase YafO
MAIVVEFSPDTYDDLFKDVLSNHPTILSSLRDDFCTYIASNRMTLPMYFGCDVPYLYPHEAYVNGLMHIHIAIPPLKFSSNKPQHDRKCPGHPTKQGDPAKDAALVYAQGLYDEDRYILIAMLHPGAHGKAQDDKIMKRLAGVAKSFRDKY